MNDLRPNPFLTEGYLNGWGSNPMNRRTEAPGELARRAQTVNWLREAAFVGSDEALAEMEKVGTVRDTVDTALGRSAAVDRLTARETLLAAAALWDYRPPVEAGPSNP